MRTPEVATPLLERELANWREGAEDVDYGDICHVLLERKNLLDWTDVSDEAFHLLCMAEPGEYDDDLSQPAEWAIESAASNGARGAFQAVANALGIDIHDLRGVVEGFSGEAIGFDGLQTAVAEHRKRRS